MANPYVTVMTCYVYKGKSQLGMRDRARRKVTLVDGKPTCKFGKQVVKLRKLKSGEYSGRLLIPARMTLDQAVSKASLGNVADMQAQMPAMLAAMQAMIAKFGGQR